MFTSIAPKICGVVAAVAALALAPAALASASPTTADPDRAAVPRYRMVDLGTLGGESSFATAMNDRGAVIGRSQTADGAYHGFVWDDGTMTDLGPLSPNGINNRGEIIGTRDDVGGAFVWSGGVLSPLPGGLRHPTAINDRGDVVGIRAVDDNPANVPVLVSAGKVRRLPLDTVSDVNDHREVSGGLADGLEGFHASSWRRGTVTDLGAASFNRSNTVEINDHGWVIGFTFSPAQFERGALWRHGRRTDLGTLGGELTHAVSIDDHGDILVTSQTPDGNVHPALWRHGALVDLSNRGVAADGDVVDSNNRGDIAGSIRPEFGIAHAVVYQPVPRT